MILILWGGLVFLLNRASENRVTPKVALNFLLVGLIVFLALPLMHWAQYRRSWRKKHGRSQPGQKPGFDAQQIEPPPSVTISFGQKLFFFLVYALGAASLLVLFAPYGHQQ